MEWLLIVVLYGYREPAITIHEIKSEELCNKVGVMLTKEMNRNPTSSYINWSGRYKCIPNN